MISSPEEMLMNGSTLHNFAAVVARLPEAERPVDPHTYGIGEPISS